MNADPQETYTDDTGRVWHPHRGYWCWKTAHALAQAESNNAVLISALRDVLDAWDSDPNNPTDRFKGNITKAHEAGLVALSKAESSQ